MFVIFDSPPTCRGRGLLHIRHYAIILHSIFLWASYVMFPLNCVLLIFCELYVHSFMPLSFRSYLVCLILTFVEYIFILFLISVFLIVSFMCNLLSFRCVSFLFNGAWRFVRVSKLVSTLPTVLFGCFLQYMLFAGILEQ